jgi:hypothetical protein
MVKGISSGNISVGTRFEIVSLQLVDLWIASLAITVFLLAAVVMMQTRSTFVFSSVLKRSFSKSVTASVQQYSTKTLH